MSPPSADASTPGEFTARGVGTAIGVCLFTQTLASVALSSAAVIAPVAAPQFGVAASAVGYFVAPVYIVGIGGGLLAAGLMRRYGALRLFQIGLLLLTAGLLLATTAKAFLLPLCVLCIGIPYGVINPLSAHVLSLRTPKRYMATIFSLKQTGVPLGSVLAGVTIPPLLLVMPWPMALSVIAAACLLWALALQPLRADYDADRNPEAPVRLGNVAAPVAVAWRNPKLRELSLASGTYSFGQVNLTTFLVSYYNLEIGMTLVAAGAVFAFAQLTGMAGRVFWGSVADRWVQPRVMLGMLGIAMAALQCIAATFSLSWPMVAITALSMLLGGTAIAWNGVHFAEVTRRAPSDQAGSANAGVQFYTFGGALLGPIVFSPLVSLTGSYALSFAITAVLPLIVGLRLLLRPA